MDRQIQKLKKLIDENLYQSKDRILRKFGKPRKRSENEIWFFRKLSFSLFNDEIAFIFEEDIVVDISFTQYFLWFEIKSIFYFEGQKQQFKVIKHI